MERFRWTLFGGEKTKIIFRMHSFFFLHYYNKQARIFHKQKKKERERKKKKERNCYSCALGNLRVL